MINFIEILIRCCEKQEKKLEIESNYGSFKLSAKHLNISEIISKAPQIYHISQVFLFTRHPKLPPTTSPCVHSKPVIFS